MFTMEEIDTLPDDPIAAARILCNRFQQRDIEWQDEENTFLQHKDDYVRANCALAALKGEYDIACTYSGPNPSTQDLFATVRSNFRSLSEWIDQQHFNEIENEFRSAFKRKSKKMITYEFTQGDLDLLQQKINELRSLIVESEFLDEEFRRRLLMRLERLQRELHKRMSDLDRLWGLLADAGVALYKFGENAKPLVDRIREIAGIAWRTQARAEELPSDAPLPQITRLTERR